MGYEQGRSAGSQSLLEGSWKKLEDILRNHQPVPIPARQAQEIQKIVDEFEV